MSQLRIDRVQVEHTGRICIDFTCGPCPLLVTWQGCSLLWKSLASLQLDVCHALRHSQHALANGDLAVLVPLLLAERLMEDPRLRDPEALAGLVFDVSLTRA